MDFSKIEMVTTPDFTKGFREKYESELALRIDEVKAKIKSNPNYLFIMLSVLNQRGPSLDEVALMSGGIIHV